MRYNAVQRQQGRQHKDKPRAKEAFPEREASGLDETNLQKVYIISF